MDETHRRTIGREKERGQAGELLQKQEIAFVVDAARPTRQQREEEEGEEDGEDDDDDDDDDGASVTAVVSMGV